MDFGFSEEQEMLRASARKFFENECTSTVVRQRMEEPAGVTDDFWTKLAEQGWLGLVYPEEFGGVGLGFVDLTVLMEEMGRVVMPGPFLATLLGGLAILEAGSAEQKKQWLPRLADGKAKAALAWTEPSARWDAAGVATTAKPTADGWLLSGTKLFVLDAHIADVTAVVARTAENKAGQPGLSLFLVPKDGASAPLSRVLERATVALCAEMCGGAQKVLEMTTEYAKIRVAFNRPIGSYQGVKHRAADMLVDVENAKSLTYYAAWAVDENVPDSALAVSMAKAYASDAFRRVSAAGIQLHGGIGFTWEHDLHLYFKRAKSSEFTFGDATHHREKA